MHELSIAHSLVELAQQHLPPGEVRVLAVDVRIGALAGVVGDALAFCYGIATEGTALHGSTLRLHHQPVVLHCAVCEADRELEGPFVLRCPVCATPSAALTHGRELELMSIEYDPAEDGPP